MPIRFSLCDHTGTVFPVLRARYVKHIIDPAGDLVIGLVRVGPFQDLSDDESVYLVWNSNQEVVREGQVGLNVWIAGGVVTWEMGGGPAFLESWGECIHDPIYLRLPDGSGGVNRVRIWSSLEALERNQDELPGTPKEPTQPTQGSPEYGVLCVTASAHA